jgi:hypothetical protein
MARLISHALFGAFLGLTSSVPGSAQSPVPGKRVESIRDLSNQLRWHGEDGHNEYERTKAAVTERLLEQVDGFVVDNFLPGRATADSVREGVDDLLGRKKGDGIHDVAFSANLPAGNFLILGVELWRGGGALLEDAISFRAYSQNGGRLVPVAHTDVWDGVDVWAGVNNLHAKPLPTAPVPGEFWFLALGQVHPSLTPPEIAIKLWAFDGRSFRAVWTPENITAEGPAEAVELTAAGFIVVSLVDPTGGAARSPNLVVHREFLLSPDGPQKVGQWKTELR